MPTLDETKQRTLIVTGAASGLGKATAERACGNGLNVVLADINKEDLENAVLELSGEHEKRIGVAVDVTDNASVEALVERAVAAFGQIHCVIHCAGVARSPTQKGVDGWLPIEEISEADWDFVTEVNLKGTFLVNQAVGRHMLAHRYGRIVNVASISALVANQKLLGHAPYNAAKAGVVALTKVLAVEWAHRGVTVNAISPGYMKTELGMRSLDYVEGFKEFLDERTAQRRLGEPREFAAVVDFLSSDDASHIAGHNLVMDGGYTAW